MNAEDEDRILNDLTDLMPQDLLDVLTARVAQGASTYGSLDLATDTRDFLSEGLQELLDACFYLGAATQRESVLTSHGWHLDSLLERLADITTEVAALQQSPVYQAELEMDQEDVIVVAGKGGAKAILRRIN